ncbi:hypothetical protein [Streptomyces sp. YIM S03343]
MKFLAITLIVHAPHPVPGVRKPTQDRFREVLDKAPPFSWGPVLAEPVPASVPADH